MPESTAAALATKSASGPHDRAIYRSPSRLAYTGSLFVHSWDESVAFWETDRKAIIGELCFLTLGALAWSLIRGWQYTMNEVLLGVAVTVGPPVAAAVGLYVWGVLKAPYALHREAQIKIKEAHGTNLSLMTETEEDKYWRLRYTAEAPELAMKIVTGYTGPATKSNPEPYLAIEYVPEWHNYVMESDPDEGVHTELVEFLKFTNASNEVIRKIQVAPFAIWGVGVSTESVPTLIQGGEPVKKRVRKIESQLQKANIGLRAFHKIPVGVPLTVTYYGQHDDNEPILARHALIYDKGNIRVEPLIGKTAADWLDASEVVVSSDERDAE